MYTEESDIKDGIYYIFPLIKIFESVMVLVTQSCPTLCNPMDCSLPDSSVMEFSRQVYWSGLPFPSPGDLPD